MPEGIKEPKHIKNLLIATDRRQKPKSTQRKNNKVYKIKIYVLSYSLRNSLNNHVRNEHSPLPADTNLYPSRDVYKPSAGKLPHQVDSLTYLQDPSQKFVSGTEIKAKQFLLSPYNSKLNRKWIQFKQKKVVTKNKVGFFVLKGNTFFNTSTKFTNKLVNHHHKRNTPPLTFVLNKKIYNFDYSTLIQDTRYLDLTLCLELQKIHLNFNFLILKPLSDKLEFSQSLKAMILHSMLPASISMHGQTQYISSKEHHNRWNVIPTIKPSATVGSVTGGLRPSKPNEQLFLNFLKPINVKSALYVQKEIFVCASFNNYNNISLQKLRLLYINVLKDFITTNVFSSQSSDEQTPLNLLLKSSKYKNVPFEVIKKSGQLIHMNKHKITLRLGQPLVISPRSIIHATHGDFISSKTAVITLTYQQLKTGDIVQGIPKIEQLFEARTTKRGRLFRDNVTNLLTGLFLKYFVKSTYLLRKNIIPLRDGSLTSRPSDKANRMDLFKLSLNRSKAFAPNSTLVNNKQHQTLILALALQWSVKQSFYKIQQIIVDGILRVYRSQGVSIADKHVEIIVKQMTSKVKIINSNASKMNDYSFSLQNINRSLDTEVHNNMNTKRPVLLTSNNKDFGRYEQKDSTKVKSKKRKTKRNNYSKQVQQAPKLPKKSLLESKSSVPFENKLLERLVANNVEGPTGLFPGEIVDIDFVENINTFLLKTASLEALNSYSQIIDDTTLYAEGSTIARVRSGLQTDMSASGIENRAHNLCASSSIEPIKYEPIVLGITRASLEVESFLSAASFQQTTRVLSQAALYKKKDFLKGLKENIIIGNLIPAGTGYLSSINV
jgi:DNA-directed RNA polymerase subunit beta'